jgi:Putative zinc-binding metallo-peptidase
MEIWTGPRRASKSVKPALCALNEQQLSRRHEIRRKHPCHDRTRARVRLPGLSGLRPVRVAQPSQLPGGVGLTCTDQNEVATSFGCAIIAGRRWVACTKAASLGCNWLVPEEQHHDGQRGRCLADSLIRREPDADDTIAVEKLVSTAMALRRLIYQLLDLGLHVDPFWRTEGGLAFDLLSSYSAGERVVIGHAGGVITIDLVESSTATASRYGFAWASRIGPCLAIFATRSALIPERTRGERSGSAALSR